MKRLSPERFRPAAAAALACAVALGGSAVRPALAGDTAAAAAQWKPQPASVSSETADSKIALPDSVHPDIKTVIPAGIFQGSFQKEDGPFLIDGSITVPSGQTLEFGPGSVIYIGGPYSTITVFGQMFARGTPERPVVFQSARRRPNPWDWDRIYCRSRNRSIFEHCVVRHSNYGISVENGSASITGCLLERNSLYAVTVKNAEVDISKTTICGGQVMGMYLTAGAVVSGDSLSVFDNTTGIGCDGTAALRLAGGSISRNVNGMVVTAEASVSMVGTEVSRNKTGIVSQKGIPKKERQMVFANGNDEKIVSGGEIRKLLKEPEAVRSIALPRTQAAIAPRQGFSSGFSAAAQETAQAGSFIGNVTAGFRHFRSQSLKHPAQDSVFKQTIYPDGLQPEVQVFMSGKRGAADVNLLVDVYENPWLLGEGSVGKNIVNLGLTYDNHTLTFGDFNEGGSETSLSGRQMTGVRYTGYYWDMGGGMKRMEYKLAAGESEVPMDSGHHDLNQYNVTVDSGMSRRQQITYIMATTLRPTRTTTVSAQGIIARDQVDQPLFRAPITDPGAPRPVQSQTGVLGGTMNILKGAVELFAEIDLGTHDTVDTATMRKIAWYNPRLDDALPKVFKNFLSKSEFSDHFAVSGGGRGLYRGCAMSLSYTEIGPHYFSAGNPYLEVNRRIGRAGIDRQFRQNLSAGAVYEYERTMASGTPTNRNTLNLKSEYSLGENRPAFVLNYTGRIETNTSTERYTIAAVDSTASDSSVYAPYRYEKLTTIAGLETKQNLPNGISYSCSYQMLWDNDLAQHAAVENNGLYDRMQHQFSGWFSCKVKKILRNKLSARVTLKNENRDSLHSVAFKISDQLGITVVPRRLSFALAGEFSNKEEKVFTTDSLTSLVYGWQAPVVTRLRGAELEAKYSATARLSFSLKARYERGYDAVQGSRGNYAVTIAGLHATYLF